MSACDHEGRVTGYSKLDHETHCLHYIVRCDACEQEWLYDIGDPYWPSFSEGPAKLGG